MLTETIVITLSYFILMMAIQGIKYGFEVENINRTDDRLALVVKGGSIYLD